MLIASISVYSILIVYFGTLEAIPQYDVKEKTVYYDSLTSLPIGNDELKKLDKANITFWCVTDVKEPCNPLEGRRIDGSCNNLQRILEGARHTPFYSLLPPNYDTKSGTFEPRKSNNGEPLPLARAVRTALFGEGYAPHNKFTHMLTNMLVYMAGDALSVQDTVNFIAWKPYCCEPKGQKDYACVPNYIPQNDPVHRFSGENCINMTRPITFQSQGCSDNKTLPNRINSGTNLIDLSPIYGNTEKAHRDRGRLFKDGLLKFEIENGRIFPPSAKTKVTVCRHNVPPFEKRCHGAPEDGINTLFGINLVGIWFWRSHNRIAAELQKYNPCWDDDKLFDTARDINIAILQQIVYYELLPTFLGRIHILRDGLIQESPGFRDIYNPAIPIKLSVEYPYIQRWAHTIQEGRVKLYNPEGHYVGQIPYVNLTLRTGWLADHDNMDTATQGAFRQACSAHDRMMDPDIAELGMGPSQRVLDITTNDVAKARYLGLQPYIKYLEYCSGRVIKTFEDLLIVMDQENIELLKDVYKHVEDIDLIAGVWMERLMAGGNTPPTFYCITVDQLLKNVVSDRHWFERPNRPNAFSFEQLLEIRKMTMSRLVCDVGDKMTEIQPNSFRKISWRNPLRSCRSYPKIDFSKWKDFSCQFGDFKNLPKNPVS